MPPTRMLVKTKSAHATHSATESHERDAALRRPCARRRRRWPPGASDRRRRARSARSADRIRQPADEQRRAHARRRRSPRSSFAHACAGLGLRTRLSARTSALAWVTRRRRRRPASTARRRSCRGAGTRAAAGRSSQAVRKPPLNASPAPVVSTARTRGAGARYRRRAWQPSRDPAAAARSQLDDRVARVCRQ